MDLVFPRFSLLMFFFFFQTYFRSIENFIFEGFNYRILCGTNFGFPLLLLLTSEIVSRY